LCREPIKGFKKLKVDDLGTTSIVIKNLIEKEILNCNNGVRQGKFGWEADPEACPSRVTRPT